MSGEDGCWLVARLDILNHPSTLQQSVSAKMSISIPLDKERLHMEEAHFLIAKQGALENKWLDFKR